MRTLTEVLAPFDIPAADEALADIEVPVLAGQPQRQGDVFVIPADPVAKVGEPVPVQGIAVVRGEATGNTHLLIAADGPVFFLPAVQRVGSLDLGTVTVPDGSVAYLIHTDEHGANGIGAGTYRLHGKREQAEEIRRVAD